MKLKNTQGVVVFEFVFTRPELSVLLEEVGFSKSTIANFWGDGSQDSQNVPGGMKLLLVMAFFETKTPNDFSNRKNIPFWSA